jgi:membrane protease YdiL (CAAX protease family)
VKTCSSGGSTDDSVTGSDDVETGVSITTVDVVATGVSIATVDVVTVEAVVGTEPEPALAWLEGMADAGIDPNQGRGDAGLLLDSFYVLCWIVPGSLFAVGYGIRRTFGEALDRLGLVRPTWRMCGVAALLTLALVGGVWVLDEVIGAFWAWTGWPATDEDTLDQLFRFAISVPGAIVIGVTAGLGEEIAVRGILQPRVGMLLSNVFFTALHAYQYNWDALLSVFLTGLVFGLIRRRSNTTLCAMTHGGFDFVVLIIALATGN